MNRKLKLGITTLIIVGILVANVSGIMACTTLIAGKKATADGSVLMAFCNDANIMSWVTIEESRLYAPGTKIPILSNRPIPGTLVEYEEQIRAGYDFHGFLEVGVDLPEKTLQYITGRARYMGREILGFNEYGVCMGAEYTPMQAALANYDGVMAGGTNHWTSSVSPIAMMQAKTAREAIQVIGSLIEKFGFQYYFASDVALAIPIVDKEEGWIMEMFPAGPDWTPGCGEPGAVWCARRVPDDHVFVYANRSVISEIDLDDTENFMGSSNIYSLAEKLGLWKPGEEFIWYKVYGNPAGAWVCMREWYAYNTLAPSKGFKSTGEADVDRYPFSVKPDKKIELQDFVKLMRSQFEGSKWDVMADPAWEIDGKISPLTRAQGPTELFDLVSSLAGREVYPQRALATDTTTQWFIVQNRDWLPEPVATSVWYTLGPSYTSVLAPLYPKITELPLSWTNKTIFNRVDRDQAAWNFNLVYNLAHFKHQEAIKDIKGVIEPAEEKLFAMRPLFEEEVIKVYEEQGEGAAIEMLTDFSYFWCNQIHNTYNELVDYLLYKYVYEETARCRLPRLPVIVPPNL